MPTETLRVLLLVLPPCPTQSKPPLSTCNTITHLCFFTLESKNLEQMNWKPAFSWAENTLNSPGRSDMKRHKVLAVKSSSDPGVLLFYLSGCSISDPGCPRCRLTPRRTRMNVPILPFVCCSALRRAPLQGDTSCQQEMPLPHTAPPHQPLGKPHSQGLSLLNPVVTGISCS